MHIVYLYLYCIYTSNYFTPNINPNYSLVV